MIEACRRAGVVFRLPRPRLSPPVKRLMAKILPGAVGAGVQQINLVIGVVLASLLPTGAVSYLYYADRVYQLPLGVIGIAVGTVKNHRKSIYRRLSISSQSALFARFLRSIGYAPPDTRRSDRATVSGSRSCPFGDMGSAAWRH